MNKKDMLTIDASKDGCKITLMGGESWTIPILGIMDLGHNGNRLSVLLTIGSLISVAEKMGFNVPENGEPSEEDSEWMQDPSWAHEEREDNGNDSNFYFHFQDGRQSKRRINWDLDKMFYISCQGDEPEPSWILDCDIVIEK